MIRTLNLRGKRPSRSELLTLIPRNAIDVDAASAVASDLIADVRERGSVALREQAQLLDHVSEYDIRVPASHFEDALTALDPDLLSALQETIARVRLASAAQVPPAHTTQVAPGATVIQRWQPVERVGLYVPGGKAVYPSSVIMNVVPAQVAGVDSIALASPPQQYFGGRVHPTILAAASLLGVTEVYAMGGAGAIGAFAYGVPDLELEPVNVVTGPGNLYVAAAKRLVRGVVGIDSEAGPTEILIIADHTASADLVAADLISQAEHDELASAVLVTDSADLLDAVRAELERQTSTTTHRERVQTACGGEQSALVLVDDLEVATDFSNAYGPEHLEIQTANPQVELSRIVNAGAVFLGDFTPVSLGDYSAGSNHVLPTAGQALFSAGLGAYTFLRAQQIIQYDKAALGVVAAGIRRLSNDEDLPAHGDAVDARFTVNNN
ncbi:histidinol dehydrogenase [Alpinimonas psychrophila]|uniref:Histidinol dehydrogenase n=1 Tax=Alpinimonas psychrophila TaxID=748908 RepID=A0A7W3JSF9_9MICO|nr:histidinol dehydrogenase [Alpinimonas psychrophila]MBA8828371.1 histidinol dehydrogenase [Alpinimonas psychrophila]